MYRLLNPTRNYAWGSRTALADLLGRPAPDGEPEAELWVGAHPAASSLLVGADGARTPLDAAIAEHPAQMLGPAGPVLPFLLKVLAVDQPLSLQVHPDRSAAAAGFAAEEAAGPARDAETRTFRDANHKPELVCALTPFDALCGLRPEAEIMALLGELAVPQLAAAAEGLAGHGGADALRHLVETILGSADPSELVDRVADRARRQREGSPWAESYDCAIDLAERCPGDPGVVVSLLLNLVHLRPGEAMYTPPGRLHAYLRGVAIELMASSDNVVRGGLTGKHVDVDQLLRLTDFEAARIEVITAQADGTGWNRYPVPVPDFALSTVDLGDGAVSSHDPGPQVLFCLDGAVAVQDGIATLNLARGQSLFAVAGTHLTARGTGRLVRATAGA
ncbi:MAG: mannose-6-phosphate isomerase, class I [Geodermatophilaceae bacterium]|nr:mannose-6-phosphate isomerase, class I [Geodermatophilaceae bacterium]